MVTVRSSTALPTFVNLDERRLTQIANHLVSNALKFTERGNVEVTAVRAPAGLALQVRDTGIGMSAAQLRGRLDAFEQLEDTSNRRFDGLGLGLTLCRKLLGAFGGSLTLESALGRGTTATAFIPLEISPVSDSSEQMVVIYSNKPQDKVDVARVEGNQR